MEELTTFNFTIIYYKKVKNLINGLFRQPDFKDDNKLSTIKRQSLLNFLSKFQKHLKNTKNNPVKKQNIDFDKTSLSKNVLNLVEALQGTNSTRVLSIKSESKNDPVKEQSIDSNETFLLGNVLSLTRAL